MPDKIGNEFEEALSGDLLAPETMWSYHCKNLAQQDCIAVRRQSATLK